MNYDNYIHEFTNSKGKIRHAVCVWNEKNSQYTAPLDEETARLTGCSAEYSRTLEGIGGYKTRRQARYYARKLFG